MVARAAGAAGSGPVSALRFAYDTLSPEAYAGLLAVHRALQKSPLGKSLIELVSLRASQINGCVYCMEMHAAALRASGTEAARLDGLPGWRLSSHFSARERAALAWAEAITEVTRSGAPDADFEALRAHFSEVEIADLSVAIALINAFNRLAVAARR